MSVDALGFHMILVGSSLLSRVKVRSLLHNTGTAGLLLLPGALCKPRTLQRLYSPHWTETPHLAIGLPKSPGASGTDWAPYSGCCTLARPWAVGTSISLHPINR